MAGIQDLVNQAQGAVTNLANMVTAFQNAFPRITGSFTLAAATTTVVAQPAITAGSIVIPFATNGTAALTVSNNGLYHSANTPGVSFAMATYSGAAIGSETFAYIIVNPS
jgi:hypothetical protein